MRTHVYVDGFNLYYGALKGTSWKWLDLPTLFAAILQAHHDIAKVKYFTARVSSMPDDLSKPQRQDVYLRALCQYRPEVEMHFGHFLSHRVRAPLARPMPGAQRSVEIVRTEEKGSDVNLAVHMLNDAWLDACDCAVVVSNDSDIAEAMRLVKQQHEKRIGLLTPGPRKPSQQLLKHADFARHIRPGALRASQLPDPIPGTNIRKPARW
ncbi:MAG: NYN domain-containing protein [Immundisolibacterales bacterium]|nr:NYN domain-containing protein [Immundisolibacterales bacterium]